MLENLCRSNEEQASNCGETISHEMGDYSNLRKLYHSQDIRLHLTV